MLIKKKSRPGGIAQPDWIVTEELKDLIHQVYVFLILSISL